MCEAYLQRVYGKKTELCFHARARTRGGGFRWLQVFVPTGCQNTLAYLWPFTPPASPESLVLAPETIVPMETSAIMH